MEEIRQNYTGLSLPQAELLKKISLYASFAAAAAGQPLIIFVEEKNGKLQELKRVGEDSFSMKALPLHAAETVIWEEALHNAIPVTTESKSFYGETCRVAIFPIIDNGGKAIGGVAFLEKAENKSFYLLAETAYMAMMVPDQKQQGLYKPIAFDEGVIIFAADGEILYANEMASHLAKLLGVDRRLIGTSIFNSSLKLSTVRQAFASHQAVYREEIYGDLHLQETIIPILRSGKVVRSYLFLKNCTMEKKAQQALLVKNSVIKEVHHRVKNNLQTVSGLLRMQARRSTSDEVKLALQGSVQRIESMALVHDIISHYDEEYIQLRVIAEELMRLLRHSMLPQEAHIVCEYEGADVLLSSHQASYISLVLNELLSNACKHGLQEQADGFLHVGAELQGNHLTIEVSNSGALIAEPVDKHGLNSLGLRIIRNVVENELHGNLKFTNRPEGGLCVTVTGIYEVDDEDSYSR